MPTKIEIDKLKREWLSDAIWDIEDTEGFEEHREELLAFRLEQEKIWEQEREDKKLEDIEQARKMGVEGLYKLCLKQQEQIDNLTKALLLLTEGQSHEAYKAIANMNHN